MRNRYPLYAQFMAEYPEVFEKNEALGEYIHKHGGPLDEKTRWLIKLGVSAATRHENAVGTHIAKAREAGAKDDEIVQAMLLIVPTCGFATFMEAYRIFKQEEE
jgi:4-carboxymuconolactone decarboxylase